MRMTNLCEFVQNRPLYSLYRKSENFRCKNIFVVDGGYEN